MNEMVNNMNSSANITSDATVTTDQHAVIVAVAHSLASGMPLTEIVDPDCDNNVDLSPEAYLVGLESIAHVNSVLTSVGAITPEEATDIEGEHKFVISEHMASAIAIMHTTTAFVFRDKFTRASNIAQTYFRLLMLSVACNVIMMVSAWLK